VVTRTFAVKNISTSGGLSSAPATWDFPYGGEFTSVYAAYAVLQGFSIWNNENMLDFPSWGSNPVPGAIPQHVFVQVQGFDTTHTFGTCFASESFDPDSDDNTVLFTVVVLGRKL